MERGAIDFIEKPNNLIETKGQRFREKLIKVLATITAAGSTQTYQKKVITNVVKPAYAEPQEQVHPYWISAMESHSVRILDRLWNMQLQQSCSGLHPSF